MPAAKKRKPKRESKLQCIICRRLNGFIRTDLGGAEPEAACDECHDDKRRIAAWKKWMWRD